MAVAMVVRRRSHSAFASPSYGVVKLFSRFFFFAVASSSSQAAYSSFAFQFCCRFSFRYVTKRHRFEKEEAC
ncbi:hypothetical protein S83_023938 [Arachis hypogaea]